MYSQDDSKIESLRDYLAVANAFMKANSTSGSSAVVKRLFKVAGQIRNPRRCKKFFL
jgi:hypothetical protein